jgi:flagellar basal-body rod modification protein FlgD
MTTSPTNASQSTETSSTPLPARQDPLTQKETFLKLLVAQIKNQDPLNPTDGTQFLGQLAQFTELEQVMNIRVAVEDISGTLKQGRPAESTGENGGNSTQETN